MRYFSFLFLLCCCNLTLAQKNYHSDTVLWQQAGTQTMQYLFDHTVLLQDTARNNFGDISVYYDLKNQNYRSSQKAQRTTIAALEARGINYLTDKIVVSGTFSYAKSWEDSLAYFLGGLDDNRIPGYFYTPKAGKFERQTYDAQAQLGYKLDQHWQTGIQANYTHHWATRSVDPRMEHYSMKFLLKPSLSYVTSSQQHFSITGIWGYGKGRTDLSYKNQKLNQGISYPEYHYYSSFGYGSIKALDSASIQQYDRYRGLELAGKLNKPQWILYWSASYLQRKNEHTNDVRHLQDYLIKQTFDLDQIAIDLLFRDKRINGNLVRFSLTNESGKDGIYHKGSNYFLTRWNSSLLYSKAFSSQTSTPKEVGISIESLYDKRDDALTALAERSWIALSLPLSWTKIGQSNDRFRLQFTPSYRLKLTNSLQIPSGQLNSFTAGIAYPEFYYYDTNVLGIQTRLSYLTSKIWRTARTSFFVDFKFEASENASPRLMEGTTAFRGKNTNLRLGVNFYL